MRYLISLIGVAVGALIVIYSEKIYEQMGPSEWAERKLGPGGSHLFYKLIGIAIIFLALFYMSGILQSVGFAIFGRLFGLQR